MSHAAAPSPADSGIVWLGQSARTTVVTRAYPELAGARWLASLGDTVHRPRMLETVFGPDLRSRLGITGPLMLDSGGFTTMMQGSGLGIEGVARAFGRCPSDIFISLDFPPLATDTIEVRADKYRRTAESFDALRQLPLAGTLAPVVHGTTPEELEANCDAILRLEANPAWVCVGGLVPLLRQSGQRGAAASLVKEELSTRIRMVRARFETSTLHVLGAGSPRTVALAFQAGADSVDSIGWRRAAGFGTIFLPGGPERFVASRDRKRAASRLTLTDADHDELSQCECPACRRVSDLAGRVELLSGSYLPRAAHNAWILIGAARAPKAVLSDSRQLVSAETQLPQYAEALGGERPPLGQGG